MMISAGNPLTKVLADLQLAKNKLDEGIRQIESTDAVKNNEEALAALRAKKRYFDVQFAEIEAGLRKYYEKFWEEERRN